MMNCDIVTNILKEHLGQTSTIHSSGVAFLLVCVRSKQLIRYGIACSLARSGIRRPASTRARILLQPLGTSSRFPHTTHRGARWLYAMPPPALVATH